ncbi:MAG TPA: dihydroorotate dehydrogenase electron transfer subunit [Acidobacteriota bacterium]|nr:dihydroorotate dehydrogenase electron transfer subunit [Acidobacteriota bacterium]
MRRPRLAELVRSRRIGPDIYQQRYADRLIAGQARAGQFVQLLPGESHLFRRPFSVYATDPDAGTFDVLFQVLGEGTRCLTCLPHGTTVDVLGPLGNRFRPPRRGQIPVLVGGGLGMAPLRLWACEIISATQSRNSLTQPVMILGARTRALALAPMGLSKLGLRPYWATDDGTRGLRGTAVDLLARLIEKSGADHRRMIVYGCGPEPMMEALARFCTDRAIDCQVSLERSMPCGFGVCMGCVVTARDASGYETYRRVCRDGPVFDAGSISFR